VEGPELESGLDSIRLGLYFYSV